METNIQLILAFVMIQITFNCFIKKSKVKLHGIINCFFSLITSIISIHTTYVFLKNGMTFVKLTLGIFPINIEPITLIFLCMVNVLWFINNIYSHGYLLMNSEIDRKKFNLCTTASILSTIMIAFSSNLIAAFVFYELLTVFTYPLVANTHTKHETNEAKFYLYFLVTTASIILLPIILFLGTQHGTTSFQVGGILNNKYQNMIPLLILSLYGLAKAAAIPVHYWLPRAMVAPVPVSSLLHAVAVVKSGIFILLKMYLYIFGLKSLESVPTWNGINIVMLLCTASLILSAIVALYQNTLKKLLAYSTICQLSICLLAASLFTIHGIKASVLHMVSHAFAKITLFFAVGYIYCNSRITKIEDINGLAKKLPLTCILFCVGTLSIIGIPPFAGFISKAYIFYSALKSSQTNYFVIAALITSILLTTQYFGIIIYKIYFKKIDINYKAIYPEKAHSMMLIGTIASAILTCLFIVLYPYMIMLLERIQY